MTVVERIREILLPLPKERKPPSLMVERFSLSLCGFLGIQAGTILSQKKEFLSLRKPFFSENANGKC